MNNRHLALVVAVALCGVLAVTLLLIQTGLVKSSLPHIVSAAPDRNSRDYASN